MSLIVGLWSTGLTVAIHAALQLSAERSLHKCSKLRPHAHRRHNDDENAYATCFASSFDSISERSEAKPRNSGLSRGVKLKNRISSDFENLHEFVRFLAISSTCACA
jgi:hypothetical protein